MLSEPQQKLVSSTVYLSFVKKRSRLAWGLCVFLTALVLVFDLVSIYMPAFAGAPAWEGTVLSRGIILAFIIIFTVIVSAVYYVHWVNKNHRALLDAIGE